jgi:hypothetical protein
MADIPEFIYRSGRSLKALSLHRTVDWLTGLSFRDYPYSKEYLQLEVRLLINHGFIVRPDTDTLMTIVHTNDPYIEPNTGEQWAFDEGHVSVWHPDKVYWDEWHEADKINWNKPDISPQLRYIAQAVVKIVKDE